MSSYGARPRVAESTRLCLSQLCRAKGISGDLNENGPSEIVEGLLYLGDCANADSLDQLRHFGISHVLSATVTRELGEHEGMERLFINVRDVDGEDIAKFFDEACKFIEGAKTAGKRVLVHCMAGRSRSATLVIAYLMRSMRMPLHEAFILAKTKRPIVFPNVGFWKQLREEELRLFGENSAMPNVYQQTIEILAKDKSAAVSPSNLFTQYMAAAAILEPEFAEEQKTRTLDMWPNAWSASKSIEEICTYSMEDVKSDARILAVEFIGKLVERAHFTPAEVWEGFRLLQDLDLKDIRMDVPKADEYIAQLLEEANARDLV